MAITNEIFGTHRFHEKKIKEAINLLRDEKIIIYNEEGRLIINRRKI
tara:strand:+ start:5765 stop:5905 length:141 start_codon:yes stop_codon:yes gene_type:complete